jgi:flagellar L-ring protein FlgH
MRPNSSRRRWGIAALLPLICSTATSQSLYDEQAFRPLTADNKARRVGDVITIQVVESAVATANADTGTQRKNGISLDVSRPTRIPLSAGLGINSDFDGGGTTARAGKLLTQLTVSVRDVLANGDLLVSGEQQLLINQERQRIGISGRVRVQDISDANVVLSTRVADADITYVGEGHLADRQKPAWWRQALDALGF